MLRRGHRILGNRGERRNYRQKEAESNVQQNLTNLIIRYFPKQVEILWRKGQCGILSATFVDMNIGPRETPPPPTLAPCIAHHSAVPCGREPWQELRELRVLRREGRLLFHDQ